MRISVITFERQQVLLYGLIVFFRHYIKGSEVNQDSKQVGGTLGVHDVDQSQVSDQLKGVCSTPDLAERCPQKVIDEYGEDTCVLFGFSGNFLLFEGFELVAGLGRCLNRQ